MVLTSVTTTPPPPPIMSDQYVTIKEESMESTRGRKILKVGYGSVNAASEFSSVSVGKIYFKLYIYAKLHV